MGMGRVGVPSSLSCTCMKPIMTMTSNAYMISNWLFS